MIVQILVAQCQAVDPLGHQLFHRVFHQKRIASVQKTPRQAGQQIQPPVGFPQQQPTAVGGNGSAIESRYYLAGKMGCKLERRLGTLCHSKRPLSFWR